MPFCYADGLILSIIHFLFNGFDISPDAGVSQTDVEANVAPSANAQLTAINGL